ncbi:putative transcriptional regulatory protein [Lachnellula suecica]|uniref:Putative transcriptional regulatory protein n=1 Tax=Lachnellula suecica TaxID=602035 RepID=A0A8T9BZQ5_9HELO|nr:putative transcriptional regulatory protein [Lachnellula suecica]
MKKQEMRARGKRLRDQDEDSPAHQSDITQSFAPLNVSRPPSSKSSQPSSSRSQSFFQPQLGPPRPIEGAMQPRAGPAPPGKVAIPQLKVPKRAETSPAAFKKGRTSHACDNCRKAKSGCTGELPCLKCRNAGITCVYGDGKRDKDRKRLSRLSKETDSLTQANLEIVEALRRLQLHTDLSKEEMREAIGDILASTPISTTGDDGEGPETISPGQEEPEGGEEDDDSEVGSTGSLDVTNVDADRDDVRATGHMGKSSSVAWVKRTAEECRQSGNQSSSSRTEGNYNPASYHAEDADFEHGDMSNVNMFEWPDPRLADSLIRSYFDHVHNVFPILDRTEFTFKYTHFRPGSSDLSKEDVMWLGTLNAVFAISSVFADLNKIQQRGHYNDHLVYIARTKMLCVDQDLLYRDARVSTVCTLGLLCLYYISTSRLNRAWTICGLAIRSATTLGLHVRNEAKEVPDVEKEHRIRIWWSLYGLECSLNQLTGRPSCLSDRHISTPLPVNFNEEDFHPGQVLYDRIKDTQSPISHTHRGSSRAHHTEMHPISTGERSLTYSFPTLKLPLTSSTYFIYRTQLSIISHEIVTQLYCAATVNESWSDVQSIIREIDQRLLQWKENLPSEFDIDFDTFRQPDWNDPYVLQRTGLAMLYNSSRMILFRPCLCRFEGRIKKQSNDSQDFNQTAVVACILSARKMISLLSWSATSLEKLYAIPPWWDTLNCLCEALSVLMLEMAFRAQHMPREAGQILEDAKKGVNWLAMLSGQSIAARKAWEIFDKLIRLVAPLIHWSVFDMPTEAPLPPNYNWRRGMGSSQPQARAVQTQLSETHLRQFQNSQPNVSMPLATMSWTSQPPAFEPFPGSYDTGYSIPEQFRNPLDHSEALNRFSNIGNVHGLYDDPWTHMFGLEGEGMEFGAEERSNIGQQQQGQYEPVYNQFEGMGDFNTADSFNPGVGPTQQYQGGESSSGQQTERGLRRDFGF